jgi:hypothetical protein
MDFDDMLKDEMSGMDLEKAQLICDPKNKDGKVPPEFEIQYALDGVGTDEEALKKVLEGKSPKEIEEIRKAYAARYPGKSLDAEVMDEVSGRDQFDLTLALEGEPQDAAGKLERAKKRYEFERGSGAGLMSGFTDVFFDAGKDLDRQHDEMLVLEDKLKMVRAPSRSARTASCRWRASSRPTRRRRSTRATTGAASTPRTSRRPRTRSPTRRRMAATVVVGGAVTILTAGAAGPALAAALSAMAGTTVSVGMAGAMAAALAGGLAGMGV